MFIEHFVAEQMKMRRTCVNELTCSLAAARCRLIAAFLSPAGVTASSGPATRMSRINGAVRSAVGGRCDAMRRSGASPLNQRLIGKSATFGIDDCFG